MAHAPELPEQYVCLNCQVVYAGSVTEEDDTHHFHAPDDCVACGDADFVPMETYIAQSLSGE